MKMKKKLEKLEDAIVIGLLGLVYVSPILTFPLIAEENRRLHNKKPAVEYRLNKAEKANYSRYIPASVEANANTIQARLDDIALSAYQDFTYSMEHIMKSKESMCYSKINLTKENLGDYKIRIKRSLAKGKENCLCVSLFKEKGRKFMFSKEKLVKESLIYAGKETTSAIDTGYFIPGGAIQTAGMMLEIKDGKLVAMPDVYGAKEIENPVLFKRELTTTTYRQSIFGFMSEDAKGEEEK